MSKADRCELMRSCTSRAIRMPGSSSSATAGRTTKTSSRSAGIAPAIVRSLIPDIVVRRHAGAEIHESVFDASYDLVEYIYSKFDCTARKWIDEFKKSRDIA